MEPRRPEKESHVIFSAALDILPEIFYNSYTLLWFVVMDIGAVEDLVLLSDDQDKGTSVVEG